MNVLKAIYHRTSSLEDYLKSLPPAGCSDILQDGDKPGYKSFLRNTVVGIASGCESLQQPINYQQLSDQAEVVTRVIKKLNRQTKNTTKKKNVLLIGWQETPYRLWSAPRVPGASDTGHFLPGNTGLQLKTPNWKLLLSRIGDEVMMHLLGDLSVFVKAAPSCFIQLTGTPVYDILASLNTQTITVTAIPPPRKTAARQAVSCNGLQQAERAKTGRGKKRKRESCDGDDSVVPAKRIHQDILPCSSVQSTQIRTQSEPSNQVTSTSKLRDETQVIGSKLKPKKKFQFRQEGYCGYRQNVACRRPSTKKMFYAVDMCYHLGGRQKLPKSHPIEAVQANASGARQITGLIFNVTYINKGYQETLWTNQAKSDSSKHGIVYQQTQGTNLTKSDISKHATGCIQQAKKGYQQTQGTNQTKPDGSKHGTECIQHAKKGYQQTQQTNKNKSDVSKHGTGYIQQAFTGLKAKKVTASREKEDLVEKTNIKSKQKTKQKPQLTPRRYIKVQKLIHTMIRQHRKTSIYHLMKFHCPAEDKLSTVNKSSIYQQQLMSSKCHQNQLSKQFTASKNESKLLDILKSVSAEGRDGPVVCRRRPPTCENQSDDSRTNNHSAIPRKDKKATQKEEIDVVSMATPTHQVYLFIRSVLIRVVPCNLWGSMYNRAAFFKFVKEYLYLGRYEKLSLQLLLNSIQVSDCVWSSLETKCASSSRPPSDLMKQHQMIADFFTWLMESYVITLVKTMFYVTESSFSRSQLLFFHKPVWLKLQRIGAKKLQAAGIIQPITEQVAMDTMTSKKSLGCSKLRFVPKKRGLRPIVSMGKSSIPTKETLSINMLLQDLFDVLTHMKNSNPALFGSAVLGTDTIYPKWRQFVQAYKQHHDYQSTQLYFIKLDIEKCYESIQHNKLFQVMTTLLNSQPDTREYVMHRYATVTLHQGQPQRAYQRHVSTNQEVVADFQRVLMGLAKQNQCLKNAVIVNQVSQHAETPSSLITRLKQHVTHDILKSGGQHYLRTSGICQGSVISSLLCSFFYAHMEKCCLAGIEDDGLLLHLVDDFLLVTPHLNKAHRFLTVLLKGLPQYGCYANPDKTLVNFDFDFEGTRIPSIPSEGLFPWCGLLFNTSKLHVNNEYARYHGVMIRYTLTMDTTGDVFTAMKTKLKKSLQAKDICIFVDPVINSCQTIVTNCYHMLLMLVFRFHAYYHNIPTSCKRAQTNQLPHNKLMGFILHLCAYFHQIVHNKLSGHNALPDGDSFTLTKAAVKWLCLKAFDVKLSRHQTTYHRLLKMIRKHRRKSALVLGSIQVADLQSCCTPDIPYDFTKML